MSNKRDLALLAGLLPLLLSAAPLAYPAATITIVNMNAPGEGFNDPTPAVPVGGNAGTTVGEQRLFAFQFAADIWGSTLDSAVEIRIQASFEPLACTATSGVLGSAGAIQIFTNFPGAQFSKTWFPVALANKLARTDLAPGPAGTSADDIIAMFNSELGKPGCLTGIGWYYGFDNNHGTDIDLVTVLLHEFAHGLGFATYVDKSTGSFAGPPFWPDIYSKYVLDTTLGLTWDVMSKSQRASSALNSRKVVWNGQEVTVAAPSVLQYGTPLLTVNSPGSIAGVYAVGTASFGPPLSSPGVTGNVVLANDGAGTVTDACEPLVNGGAIAGNIALVDRGNCLFTIKVKNAQNAGALAVIVADNQPGSPPGGMGGSDATITIPSVRITLADGNTIKAALPAVNATVGVNLAVLAGADPAGRVLVFTPNPVQPGSSVSHWDGIATPNQLMEPALNSDLTHAVQPPADLTLPLLRDIGWFADADLDGVPDAVDLCPGTIIGPPLVIGSCQTGVQDPVNPSGCTVSLAAGVANCAAGAGNGGDFASCVTHFTDELKNQGLLTGAQQGAIQSCAAKQ